MDKPYKTKVMKEHEFIAYAIKAKKISEAYKHEIKKMTIEEIV